MLISAPSLPVNAAPFSSRGPWPARNKRFPDSRAKTWYISIETALPRREKVAHETPRLHHAAWRRSGRLAAHGACAAGRADAARRRADDPGRGRSAIAPSGRGIPATAAGVELDQ